MQSFVCILDNTGHVSFQSRKSKQRSSKFKLTGPLLKALDSKVTLGGIHVVPFSLGNFVAILPLHNLPILRQESMDGVAQAKGKEMRRILHHVGKSFWDEFSFGWRCLGDFKLEN